MIKCAPISIGIRSDLSCPFLSLQLPKMRRDTSGEACGTKFSYPPHTQRWRFIFFIEKYCRWSLRDYTFGKLLRITLINHRQSQIANSALLIRNLDVSDIKFLESQCCANPASFVCSVQDMNWRNMTKYDQTKTAKLQTTPKSPPSEKLYTKSPSFLGATAARDMYQRYPWIPCFNHSSIMVFIFSRSLG